MTSPERSLFNAMLAATGQQHESTVVTEDAHCQPPPRAGLEPFSDNLLLNPAVRTIQYPGC